MSLFTSSATSKLLMNSPNGLPGGAFLGGDSIAHGHYANFFAPLKHMVDQAKNVLDQDYASEYSLKR